MYMGDGNHFGPGNHDDKMGMPGDGGGDGRTNLIVNYLPQNMTQDDMRNLFAAMGEIKTCKLIHDKVSGQSLGYGFVDYVKTEDAKKAIESLNAYHLDNKIIRVSYARPSSDTIQGTNLYITGIPKSWTQKDLECTFSHFGKIITSRVLCDKVTGIPKGVAFVRYDQRGEAETAVAAMNGKIPDSCSDPIQVKFANKPDASKNAMAQAAAASGVYGNPMQFATGAMHHTGPTGAGGPPFRYNLPGPLQPAAAAAAAAAAASGKQMLGGMARFGSGPTGGPGPAPPASTPLNGFVIFVYNLAPDADESVLWQLFGPFGAVQSVKVIRDPETKQCKGYGFVNMAKYEEALMAIQNLNGYNLGQRTLQVSFKTDKKK
ncbi:unnamed protein product [Notodromas monacha]|uniref:RRM domain-containing protein n=1 Tax=Notodromas monacha TaxID=399045 RepID=A0A7R9BFM9_9CRUS|nr:unnamed protein product [Notodromas monacha]CAG0914546.1 unnamed protein product [Notodromas monacha]